MSTGSVSGLTWWLDLNVPHVDFLIEQKHWSPLPWFPPVVWVSSLFNVNYLDISMMILQPLFTSPVHNRHEVALAIVAVGRVGSMIVISFVQDNTHQSKLACRFGVFQRFKPELIINVSAEQNVIEILIVQLSLAEMFRIYIVNILHLTDY